MRKDEALNGVAAHRAQDVGLGDGLDRLGDDLAVDALDQLDHRLDDHPRVLGSVDVGDQRRIELDPVERHRAQPREVRIAGAEIVDGDRGAVLAKRGDLGQHRVAGFHRRALGEFELDQRQRHFCVGEGVAQPAKKSGRSSWRGLTLNDTRPVKPSSRQSPSTAATSAITQSPISAITPVLSAIGMKVDGRRRPSRGWFQRSSASAPAISPVTRRHLRLEGEQELAALHRLGQRLLGLDLLLVLARQARR